MSVKIYSYSKCSTCRKALKFLDEKEIDYKVLDITETPPSKAELKKMLKELGDKKKLFNTSGLQYRSLKMSEKIPTMSDTDAIEILSKNGKLIKRPFVLSSDVKTVGFKSEQWSELF